MSSTTIRHSGVPENSDSRDSDLTAKWRSRLRDHLDESSEPDHLRHQPGDDWIVDHNRPHDPLDPGPYGSPGWYPDTRTGRHRRDELPDPLPADHHTEPAAPQQTRPERTNHRDNDPPSPAPRTTRQPRTGRDPERAETRDRRRSDASGRTFPDGTAHRFSNLREQAFDRFMIESAELRAAHFEPATPYLRERALRMLRCFLTILTCGIVPMPRPLTGCAKRKETPAPQRLPKQTSSTPLARTTMAAALSGARAARAIIKTRDPHWRTVPRQHRPRPTYQPNAYITAWEQAFDNTTLTLGGAA
ncbi:hypothetical protein AB0B28_16200 [Glycomyces sp. NPDC046736]|uniref:hypothetical protein n=1 Tax=Glycomyces sp. NPDC046736 TaxID=3155615 RepID=UPI0033EA5EAB